MATTSPNLGLTLPTVGADGDLWGGYLNDSLNVLDLAVQYGAVTIPLTNANVTLTASQAAKSVILLTGTLTANVQVIVPTTPVRPYIVSNGTTGAFTVTVKTAAGTGVIVPQGTNRLVYNGANVVFASVDTALNSTNATNATTATNVSGGTASVTTLTASGAAQLNGGATTTTLTASGNASFNGATTTLGDAGTDTTLLNAQLSAGGGVGTSGQVLNSRGVNLSPQWRDAVVLLPAVTATGTSVSFTVIPAWANRVTVMFFGLSTTGTSPVTIRVGTAGGVVATGYNAVAQGYAGTAVATTDSTSGFQVEDAGQAAFSRYGTFTIDRVSGNNWVMKGNQWRATNTGSQCAGGIGLAAALDRISVTTNGGTDTFDAGLVSVSYE